jgi:hypothetical protein
MKRNIAILIFILIGIAMAVTLTGRGPLFGWDKRFDEAALVGLSMQEIVTRFGQPNYDPRSDGSWKSEETDGPLTVSYYGRNGRTYAIRFKAGRVSSVNRYQK